MIEKNKENFVKFLEELAEEDCKFTIYVELSEKLVENHFKQKEINKEIIRLNEFLIRTNKLNNYFITERNEKGDEIIKKFVKKEDKNYISYEDFNEFNKDIEEFNNSIKTRVTERIQKTEEALKNYDKEKKLNMESIRVSKEVMKNTSDVFLDRLFDSLKSLEEIKVDGINLNQLLFEGTIKWCDELFSNKVATIEQIKNIINNNKPIDDLFNYLKEMNKKDETEVSDLITILKPVIKAFDEIIFKLTNEIEYNQNYEEKGIRALQGSGLENLENKYVYIRNCFCKQC